MELMEIQIEVLRYPYFDDIAKSLRDPKMF